MHLNRNFFLVIALLTIGFFTYSNSLNNSFHIDDNNRLVHNQSIRKVAPISRHFFDPSTNSDLPDLIQYRPWVPLSFSINYYFSKTKVKAYRITNLILLGACSIIVFYLVLLLIDLTQHSIQEPTKKLIAFFTALIYFIHPISGITVNYISARDILFMQFFLLLALISYIKAHKKKSNTYQLLSYFFLICSLFAKKNVIAFPFIILSYDLIISRKNKTALKNFLYNCTICLVFLLAIKYVLNFSDISNTQSHSRNFFSYATTQTKVHLHYLYSYINPLIIRPYPELNLPESLWNLEAIFGLTAILSSLVLAIFIREKQPLISWSIFSYWLLLAPTSSVYPLIHESMPYRPFPSILFLSLILVLLIAKTMKFKKALLLLLFSSCLLSATSIQTNKLWKNSHSLWTHTLKKGGNAKAYMAYAVGVIPNNKHALKEKYFRKALEKDPTYIFAHMQYGKLLIQNNKIEQGINYLKRAVEIRPSSPSANYYLSKGLAFKGDFKAALKSAKKAYNLGPSSNEFKKWHQSLARETNDKNLE